MRGPMTSSHRSRSKTTSPVQSEVAAAEVLAWVSDCIQGGLCFICNGVLIFENSHFAELIEAAEPLAEGLEREHQLRKSLLDEAVAWNRQPLGSKMVSGYRLQDRHGHALHYECRFNVLPYRSERGVLMVVEDVTERTLLAQEAAQAACFQSVLARIGTLAVSGASAQTLMNEAVRQTAAALEVELCKILVPRESDDHLYIMAGIGLREDLVGKLTIEGGTHSQAGYAIRERVPVVVEDLRRETRFSPSKLLTEHGGVAGMCVPMLVEDGHLHVLRLAGEDRVDLPASRLAIDTRIVYRSRALPMPDALAGALAEPVIVLLHSARAAQHFGALVDSAGIGRAHISLALFAPALVDAAGDGEVQVFPEASPPAVAAMTVPVRSGTTRANNGVVPLAADGSGRLRVLNALAGPVHVVVDTTGTSRAETTCSGRSPSSVSSSLRRRSDRLRGRSPPRAARPAGSSRP